MKRTFLVLSIIFSLSLLALLSGFRISVKADQETWTVDDDKPADFTKIQDAINSPLVSEGDIIFVYAGVYRERLVVNKTVSLIGEDVESTIIDGNNNGTVARITASNVTIHGFTIMRSGTKYEGVHVAHSTGNNISCNKITSTNEAISLYFSHNNVISNNVVQFSYSKGITLVSSDNNLILNNSVFSNVYGCYLRYSTNNTIFNNELSSSFYGIYLDSSSGNMISRNVVSDCYQTGIYLAPYSANNTVYHNIFNNTSNAQSDDANIWSYESEGNYWSDYTGQDLNEDGIGDTPYVIKTYNQDDYPLMGKPYEFEIVFEEKVYVISIISNSTISDLEFKIGAETGNKIISFNVAGAGSSVGFVRIKLPTEFMKYPYIVLENSNEVDVKTLGVSNATHVSLYFTYPHNCTLTIISPEALRLYYELLGEYYKLKDSFDALNNTYLGLLANLATLQSDLYALNGTYSDLLDDFVLLQFDLQTLNDAYNSLLDDYNFVLGNYSQLRTDFDELTLSLQRLYVLNQTYDILLNNYYILLGNYTQLRRDFEALNSSYQEHMLDYSGQVKNVQSLVYILIATTGIFITATVYLSKRAHSNASTKNRGITQT